MAFFLRSCAILALSLNLLAPGIGTAAPDKLVLANGNLTDAAAAVSIPILTEAYQRLGIKLEVQPFPFGRSLLLANEGSVDGELYRIAGIQTEYKNLVMVDVPIAMAEVAVFTNLPKLEPSFDNVRPYKLAYVRGSKLIEATLQGYQTLPLTDCLQIAEMRRPGASRWR